MELVLKNIGIVKSSLIKLDGLTVLTGRNNSGKSTVGKAMFALINSVTNLEFKYNSDKGVFYSRALERMLKAFELPTTLLRNEVVAGDDLFGRFLKYNGLSYYRSTEDDVEELFIAISKELEGNSFENYIVTLLNDAAPRISPRYLRFDKDTFPEKRQKALEISESVKKVTSSDPYLINYSRRLIERSLLEEFKNQVQTVGKPDVKSFIELKNENSIFFAISIDNNEIVNGETPVYFSSPFSSAIFIDDTSVLDTIAERNFRFTSNEELNPEDLFMYSRRFGNHHDILSLLLNKLSYSSILEEELNSKNIAPIQDLMNKVVPGNITKTDKGVFYIDGEMELNPSNLATGLKLFSIIKTLITRGALQEGTLLIIDEPEAHLHPEWQNVFAELIALLIKEIHVTVVLTTHSPNFMLAVETYVKKYQLDEKSNFYQANINSDKLINHVCVNNDLSTIYFDFTKYFSSIKAERDAYNLLAEED